MLLDCAVMSDACKDDAQPASVNASNKERSSIPSQCHLLAVAASSTLFRRRLGLLQPGESHQSSKPQLHVDMSMWHAATFAFSPAGRDLQRVSSIRSAALELKSLPMRSYFEMVSAASYFERAQHQWQHLHHLALAHKLEFGIRAPSSRPKT